ncbi:hypothetical protein [Wolbachia endosymbiont (group A) of Pogonocherus hispidulus]|uniref:hypothetical protein n=1 Tax=Wolbachia endosymbiont (group A) of Pogonocherus hispidulus TaxID=3066136 RepID=UPI0033404796
MGFLDNLDKDLNDKLAVAINKCDPKLVQILLGPGGCQLWQYWLIRAIFNYDMLSMFKVAKCEFPLSIAEKQLKALEGKSHIDNKQLQNIQEQEKESFLERIRVFYDCERKLQIQGQEHAQLEASAFAGGVLQQYEKKNMDCQTSIESAVSMNLTEESAAMIEKVSMECEKRVEDACSVNDLRRALVEEKNNLEGRKKVLSSQIVQVKDNIIDEMRDGKFLDKALVKSLYVRLLDHYLENDARDDDKNPLREYVNKRQDAKKLLLENRRQYTGFGGYIRGAASQYKDVSGKNKNEKKKNLLNIIRVLALNGTHSEGLADVFFSKNVTDQQLRTLGLQSIFTHMREAHNALFDKEVKDDFMKFMSAIVSEDGEFRNTAESVPIFRHTGSSLMKTVLENLDEVIEKIKKGERDGGLLSNFWDMLGRVFSNSSGKRHEGMNERTSEILYEVLEVSYLAIATGDDRVMVDYAREIKERKDSEKDEDIIAIYNIIYPIFEKYKDTEKEGKAEEIEKWGNFWYHFQNVFSKSCKSMEEGKFDTFFGSVWADIIGSVKTVPKEYQNYKAGHSTGGFEV